MRNIVLLLVLTIAIFSCNKKEGTQGGASHQKMVGIVVLGDMALSFKDTLNHVIKNTYGFKTIYLGTREMPGRFFIAIKSPRYRADSILRFLKTIKPDSIDYVVGLTDFDISATKKDPNGNILEPKSKYADWGIFGYGNVNGPACVVSTYRLKTNQKSLLYERVKKVVIHELGHNLGLKHCKNNYCVMTDAVEKLSTVDEESTELCGECRKEIQQ